MSDAGRTVSAGRGSGGVGSGDLFGEAGAAQPAEPGTYGLPPHAFRLPPGTGVGRVRLQVGDLARSLGFYRDALGLHELGRDGGSALLGAPGLEATAGGGAARPLVELVERPGASPVPGRGRLGLFHFALLLPDRPALGRFLAHARRLGLPLGAGDHLVSEALYLQDPDNLGIEVYADRPRAAWRRQGRELVMATDPVDMAGLLAAGGDAPWAGVPPGTVMGHVHLHVGDLAAAAAFYSEGLGFDRTVWDYPGALFLGAGGYHHHLGTNVWAGPHARPPAADEAQLLHWTLEVPDPAVVGPMAASLRGQGATAEIGADGRQLLTADPWGTRLRVVAA